jgi:hypothetical protein
MSFVGKAIRSIGRAIGILPSKKASTPPPAPEAPTAKDIEAETTQRQLAALMGGRRSTILTGPEGEEQDKLKTSKILLGSGAKK